MHLQICIFGKFNMILSCSLRLPEGTSSKASPFPKSLRILACWIGSISGSISSSKWSLVFAFLEDRMWPVWDQEVNDLNHRFFKLTLWFWRFEGHSTAFQEPQSWIQPKRDILKQLGISLSSSQRSLYDTNPNKTPSKGEIPQILPYFSCFFYHPNMCTFMTPCIIRPLLQTMNFTPVTAPPWYLLHGGYVETWLPYSESHPPAPTWPAKNPKGINCFGMTWWAASCFCKVGPGSSYKWGYNSSKWPHK